MSSGLVWRWTWVVTLCAGHAFGGAAGSDSGPITAPGQPAAGPGGSAYPYGAVITYGPFTARTPSGTDQYYIYQPAEPSPASAPAVLFLHGYGADSPEPYQVWMNHLARQGFTVVWALYDAGAADSFVTNEVADWKAALNRIGENASMTPVARGSDGQPLTGVVGHSAGAYTAFEVAALSGSESSGIPRFRAVAAMEPGQGQIPDYDFTGLDGDTLAIIAVGDQDTPKRRCTAASIWGQIAAVPVAQRNFLEVISDAHGSPAQIGNHFFPLTDTTRDTASVDDRDYNVSWKLSVAALDCAFFGKFCAYATGSGSAAQVNMGAWSDGTPVTPLRFVADPPATFAADCAEPASDPEEW